MKKFLLKMLEIYHGIPFKLQRWMTNDEAKSIEKNFSSLCDCVDKGGAYYVSYRIRPQTTDTANESIDISDNSRIGIVIQGPYFHGFTDESIRLYRKYYSNAIIVFSTWKGLPKEAEEVLKALDVIVVESEEPICSGRLNINFQIINSAVGVEAAIENGAEYICKIRSDQRMYHPMALSYLCALVNTFPLGDLAQNQDRRIVTVTMPYGNMFQPFYISDFFYFGKSNDIKKLFYISLDKRDKGGFSKGASKREMAEKDMAPESIFMRNFARLTQQPYDCTVKDYWGFVKNSLICINRNDVGLFWNKYSEKKDEARWNGYYDTREMKGEYSLYNFDFCNWLSLYTGELRYKEDYESLSEFVFK